MIKHKTRIINAIEADLHSHILNHDTLARLHLVVSDAHNEAVNTLVLSVDDGLGEHDGIVGVAGSIGDPVLL